MLQQCNACADFAQQHTHLGIELWINDLLHGPDLIHSGITKYASLYTNSILQMHVILSCNPPLGIVQATWHLGVGE